MGPKEVQIGWSCKRNNLIQLSQSTNNNNRISAGLVIGTGSGQRGRGGEFVGSGCLELIGGGIIPQRADVFARGA